ncbi:protein of unknown function (DU1801) [Flavobacterium swingsii]|jgi:hypothetical protein|uniref:YdhG-like domain-containing protein n=1 Tax=Flavobacterium swingsii TaxID=498292 RepID=A0A1I0WDT2_9FLAO|nr:DUF1801 domain-containing protein [Flavobacterium swingsii]SFA86915.1 protein of unknown function (DU1801) [Flavobacterium swingsii]
MKPTQEYILRQPEKYQAMVLHIMAVVGKIIPEAELLFKYGIPYFYYKKKPFCYLAPNHKKEFVDVGFARGFQLKQNQEFLISENRNTVKSLRYFSLSTIDNTVLISVIEEAVSLYN